MNRHRYCHIMIKIVTALAIITCIGCFYIQVHDTSTDRRATLWATLRVQFVPKDNKQSLLFSGTILRQWKGRKYSISMDQMDIFKRFDHLNYRLYPERMIEVDQPNPDPHKMKRFLYYSKHDPHWQYHFHYENADPNLEIVTEFIRQRQPAGHRRPLSSLSPEAQADFLEEQNPNQEFSEEEL